MCTGAATALELDGAPAAVDGIELLLPACRSERLRLAGWRSVVKPDTTATAGQANRLGCGVTRDCSSPLRMCRSVPSLADRPQLPS